MSPGIAKRDTEFQVWAEYLKLIDRSLLLLRVTKPPALPTNATPPVRTVTLTSMGTHTFAGFQNFGFVSCFLGKLLLKFSGQVGLKVIGTLFLLVTPADYRHTLFDFVG